MDAFDILAAYDESDPQSRARPGLPPAGVPASAQVVGVPAEPLDLDRLSREAWERAVSHVRTMVAHVIELDIEPFLAAARLLYEGAWVAEQYAAFGHLLEDDGPHLDPSPGPSGLRPSQRGRLTLRA